MMFYSKCFVVADHVLLTCDRERERVQRVVYPLISLKVERLLCKKDLRQAKRIAK